jgi:hypothetical protein
MSEIDPRVVEPLIGALQATLRLRDAEMKIQAERIAELEAECAKLRKPAARLVPKAGGDAA